MFGLPEVEYNVPMNEHEIRQFAEKWYYMGRNALNDFGDPNFGRNIGSSIALASEVDPRYAGQFTIKLSDKIDTAYIELDTRTIVVSTSYLAPETYRKRYGTDEKLEQLAIALINGTIIHEALHSRYTDLKLKTIPDFVKTVDYPLWEELSTEYGSQVVCFAFNIIEDLYIEAQLEGPLATWLQAASDILFPKDQLDDTPEELTEWGDVLNLAVQYKNRLNRGHEAFKTLPTQALNALRTAALHGKQDLKFRVKLVEKFLKAFDIDKIGEGEALASGAEKGQEGTSRETGQMLDDAEADEALVEIVAEMMDEAQEERNKRDSTKDEIVEIAGYTTRMWKPEMVDIMDNSYLESYMSIYPEPIATQDWSFLTELIAKRVPQRSPGRARTSGRLVKNRLHRIATDGKIFAKMDTQREILKRMEVIINLDMSGSTTGPLAFEMLKSVKSMSLALRKARISHSVYGHTSHSKLASGPICYRIFSYDMKTTDHNWEDRFHNARKVYMGSNFDGIVLEQLANEFTGKPAERYILTLSDGQPSGTAYNGAGATEHTIQAVAKVRKMGIKVISISVVRHVVRNNDHIYGSDWNVDVSNNIEQGFKRLMRKLV